MRWVHFSSVDRVGGAALAAYRLHRLLHDAGHDSHLIVRDRTVEDPTVITAAQPWWQARWHQLLRNLPGWRPPRGKFTFNCDWERGVSVEAAMNGLPGPPDGLVLHWVNRFLTSRAIARLARRYPVPLLQLLWDQEPVTGGCHFSFGCDHYTRSCGNCPLLSKPHEWDLSRQVWLRKRNHLAGLPITFVAVNSWCGDWVRKSSLFGQHRVEMIPIPIDPQRFVPADRATARRALGLPVERPIILFGASYLDEERKGGNHLIQALRMVKARAAEAGLPCDPLVVMIGTRGEALAAESPYETRLLGPQADDAALARCYQAADLYACPTLEDAGPMMVSEALLCGTPVVAYAMGVAPDLVRDDAGSEHDAATGYLARWNDPADFAAGLLRVLTHSAPERLSENARRAAATFHDPLRIVNRYTELLGELRAVAGLR